MYIVITTNHELHRTIRSIIKLALKPYPNLKVELGNTPGLSSFIRSREWETGIDFTLTTHVCSEDNPTHAILQPPIPDVSRKNSITISFVSPSHALANATAELISATLISEGVDEEAITIRALDLPKVSPFEMYLPAVEPRMVYVLSQKIKRQQALAELLGRSHRLESNP